MVTQMEVFNQNTCQNPKAVVKTKKNHFNESDTISTSDLLQSNMINKKELKKKLLSYNIDKNNEGLFLLTINDKPKLGSENKILKKQKHDHIIKINDPVKRNNDYHLNETSKNNRANFLSNAAAVLVDLNRQSLDSMQNLNNAEHINGRNSYFANYLLNKKMLQTSVSNNASNTGNCLTTINLNVPEKKLNNNFTASVIFHTSDSTDTGTLKGSHNKNDFSEGIRLAKKYEELRSRLRSINRSFKNSTKINFDEKIELKDIQDELFKTQFRLKPLRITSRNVSYDENSENIDPIHKKQEKISAPNRILLNLKYNLTNNYNSKTRLAKLFKSCDESLKKSMNHVIRLPESKNNTESKDSDTSMGFNDLDNIPNEDFNWERIESPHKLGKSMANGYKFCASSSGKLNSSISSRLNHHFELYQSNYYDQSNKETDKNLFNILKLD